MQGDHCPSPPPLWKDGAWWPQKAYPPLVQDETSATKADAKEWRLFLAAWQDPTLPLIETEPMRVIVLLGSKVLFISWALSGNICMPDLELIQLMLTRLPHKIIDLPHSATGEGYEQSVEWRSVAEDKQLPLACHSSLHLGSSTICRVLRPAKLPEKRLRSIRWSTTRVSGEPVYLPILPPINRFQIKVISVQKT